MSEAIGESVLPDPASMPLEDIDVSNAMLFKHDTFWPYFERLRNEDPVHYCRESAFGPFTGLWNERMNQPLGNDLISMLAHSKNTQNMDPMEYLGNLILLIVGGNDTTRNSLSGGVYFLNKNPGEYAKLRANQDLIPGIASEVIRYQTPLAHMRRTATQDYVLRGKHIKKGDKVIMWYVSANRDEDVIDNPNAFLIDRDRSRHHMSFGFGLHRCMGNRLAEMQLRTVWEEIMKRFEFVELMGEPERVQSSFVKGYETLPVRLHAR